MNEEMRKTLKEVGQKKFDGDIYNNFMALRLSLSDERDWGDIKPVGTYLEYIASKYTKNTDKEHKEMVNEINPELVEKHDKIVQEINLKIGEGVTKETDVNGIHELLDKVEELIYK